jgi:hypothetical protein
MKLIHVTLDLTSPFQPGREDAHTPHGGNRVGAFVPVCTLG